MNICVYSFADASKTTRYVDNVGDYNYTGLWSGSTAYSASQMDVVTYGSAMYICVVDNTNENPQTSSKWSILSLLYEYSSCDSNGTTTADLAYELAVTGTNLAQSAYEIAVTGTNLAQSAYEIAVTGTNLAQSAYEIAVTGTNLAQSAYEIAVTGTNLAQQAQVTATSAGSVAQQAMNRLSIGLSGTYTVWAGDSRNGQTHYQLTFINGILTSAVAT
jgi:hypothetical protein